MNVTLVENEHEGDDYRLGEMTLATIIYQDGCDWHHEVSSKGEGYYYYHQDFKMRWKVLSYMRNLNGDSIGGKLNTFEEARDFAHKYVVENLDAHLEYLKCRNPEYRRLKLLAEKNNKYNSQLIDWGNKIIKHYTK